MEERLSDQTLDQSALILHESILRGQVEGQIIDECHAIHQQFFAFSQPLIICTHTHEYIYTLLAFICDLVKLSFNDIYVQIHVKGSLN